jgi:hypothetical protein
VCGNLPRGRSELGEVWAIIDEAAHYDHLQTIAELGKR